MKKWVWFRSRSRNDYRLRPSIEAAKLADPIDLRAFLAPQLLTGTPLASCNLDPLRVTKLLCNLNRVNVKGEGNKRFCHASSR